MAGAYTVITSIFAPTVAVQKFAAIDSCQLIVVGDNKTPRDWRQDGVTYYSIDEQRRSGGRFAAVLPENHYSRKMLGYIEAHKRGATVIIDTDDDNAPKDDWAFPPFEGEYTASQPDCGFVNIYKHFTDMNIWPRGLPLDCLNKPLPLAAAPSRCSVGVWQGLADLDPDVDAIYRLTNNTPCVFHDKAPVVLEPGTVTPFNSQNTAFRFEMFPLLYLPAYVTFRFTDILRGLVAQPIMWAHGYCLGFTDATVIQERNEHDYMKDFESEIPCFLLARKVIEIVSETAGEGQSVSDDLYNSYSALRRADVVQDRELQCVEHWLRALDMP